MILENSTGEQTALATFAGGCFWCMVPPFANTKGVKEVTAGYMGGFVRNPSYERVCSGFTGHFEVVQIMYYPDLISYRQLLEIFWKQIDPTDIGGQFYDRGQQYKTAIFYHNTEQKQLAEESKAEIANRGIFDKNIVTEILEASEFYPAEEYHQDYYIKNPEQFTMYKKGSGRAQFLRDTWKEV
ncbi:MAG: peptide-methionine (S)-S-oxide reductase MsrA [Bacillota bacterium]|nr:peptide-methionine (S)-S-oxide reductase MsrA [Bacillota bacterium]